MTNGQYISVRETAQLLSVSEKKVMELIEENKLLAYRIANQFLRLKKTEVLQLMNSGKVEQETTVYPYTFPERIWDFFYFNDFYLLALAIVFLLLYFAFHA